jgi:hypothetical protein
VRSGLDACSPHASQSMRTPEALRSTDTLAIFPRRRAPTTPRREACRRPDHVAASRPAPRKAAAWAGICRPDRAGFGLFAVASVKHSCVRCLTAKRSAVWCLVTAETVSARRRRDGGLDCRSAAGLGRLTTAPGPLAVSGHERRDEETSAMTITSTTGGTAATSRARARARLRADTDRQGRTRPTARGRARKHGTIRAVRSALAGADRVPAG